MPFAVFFDGVPQFARARVPALRGAIVHALGYASRDRLDKTGRRGESGRCLPVPSAVKRGSPDDDRETCHPDRDSVAMTAGAPRMLWRAAALVPLVLPWDVGAQVGPEPMDVRPMRESMPLSAAIAEIRKSPFHVTLWSAGELVGGPLYRTEAFSASDPGSGLLRYQEARRDTVVSSARVFVAAWSIGLLVYAGGGLISQGTPYSVDYGVLAISVPIAAVGLAAWGAGANPGRAAIGSILGGAIGVPLALENPLIGITVGVVAHAAVTTLVSKIHFRRRPRP